MKKTIKYLDNDGNYQYATVKDAGDLDKLKTKAKEDLVSAINELATNGIAAGGNIDEINNKVDQIQQQANQNADALNMSDQERQEMQQQILQMQAEAQAKIAEMQKIAAEQNKKLQEASAELKKKADAIDVQKMQQDNAEVLKNSAKALEDSLAATNEDLQKTADHLNEMEIQAGVVETSVKELQNGFESKVSSADFNEARTKIQEQETMVRQLNNELSTKASNNELDIVTQRVQKAESNIHQNAQGIKASVTKETMYKEMDDFAKYRENRLKYSRDFSNDWSLNGNDVIDDDHLFDTQHDVKSVSIRNGAYLTQTTDLDTDDMSKTFTLAMWVEKGKRPRAWYGSAELTNMKVKEDKGEYQRVYWTFVPTIVKQDIKITGDTSTQGNLIISEPKLEQSDRPSAWSTNTGDQYATTEKLAHDLKLTAGKLESTITKQSEFSDRQQQDESRITQTEHGVEVANQTIVAKTDGLRQEFDGRINATSKSLTSEYKSFTNQAIGQMADGGSNLILNSSFGNLKNSYDKWTNVSPKVRIVEDDNGLKWAKMEQSGLTANSPIGLTSNLFRVKKGIVTVALDIRTDNARAIDNDNIVILESYNADQKRVFTQEVGFNAFKITKETLFDHGPHRVTYKYNQTRDDTQYMTVHIVLPKNGVLYVTNVLARTVANGEDSGEYAPNAADLHEQVVQQRTRIEQNDQAIALKADQTKVTQDIDAAKSSLSGAISRVEQRAANLEVKADGITSSVSTLSKTIDGISVGGTNLLLNTKDFTGDWYQRGSANLWDLDGRKVIHAWADWSSYITRQVIQLEQNTDYTISADIRSLDGNSSDNTVTIYGFLDGKDTQLGDLHTNGKLSSKQQRFSAVWHNTSAGQLTRFRLEGHGGWGSVHGSIYISHIKLEKGNKPTDWSPAPEDTDSNISALESRASKLEQTDSEIKASVTSVTNDLKNGRGTIKEGVLSMTDDHFSTKFSSIDNKIDGISVGGTNLVTGTSDDLENKTSSGWYYLMSQADNANFDLANYKGQVITIRAWIEKPSVDSILQMWTNNGSANGTTVKAGQSGYSTITGWTVPDTFSSWHLVYGNGGAITFGIKKLKIEHGNKPTDWSPQVSDLKLGGDNLLPNSGKMYVLADYSANSMTTRTTTTGERYDGENYKKITGEVLPKNDIYITLGKTGETYTQSIEVETDGFLKDSIMVSWFANNNVGHQTRPIHIDKLGKNTYRLWSTYSQTQDDLSIRVIDFSNFQLVGGSYIEFRHPKLERGNRPTAWTPSIDDQNGTGANILKNSSTPNASAKSSKWEDGGWRGAGHGGSKKEIREYSDSILGHVYGLHIESGSDSADVDYAQDSVPFKIGQVYTISAYACGKGTIFLEAGPGANGVWHMYTEKVGVSWKKFSYSFVADADHMNVYFGAKEANSVIDIVGMKLEYGSQATTYNTGGWEVSVNGLKSEFARLDGNTLKYSSMEQTADGFKFTVGSGNNQKTIDLNTHDNILTGTSPNWRRIPLHSSGNPWWHVNTANTRTPSMIQFPQGTTFVYSIDVKNTSNKGIKAETIWCDANGARIANSGRQGDVIQPGATGTTMVKVPPKPNGAAFIEVNVISIDGKATGEQEVQLRNEKLEVGDNPTPWCASSQDRSGNLLTGSSNFDGFNVNSGNMVVDKWVDPNGNSARKQPGVWSGYTKAIWLPRGTYTFSGYVWIQGNGLVSIYTNLDRAKDSQAAIIYNQWAYLPNITDKWQKFVFQFEVSEGGNVYPRVESTTANTTLHIGSFKVEKGLHSDAEWSDNPKTIESKTTNLQTQITATNEALESKVGKGEVFSTIKQTRDAIILTANDIELKSKTALKVGKITGKDLSIDLSNGAVDFKHGHIRGNLIDIDIDSNTIEGGTIKGAWIQAGTLASVTSQNTVTRSPIRDRYNLQPVGVDKTHVIDRHGTMVNGNNMWEIHAGDNISTDTKTHAFFSLVADYGSKHPITSELNVEKASPNGFEFLNTRSVYRFTTIRNRTRDYWTLVPIGTVLNVSAGAWDELILRYRLSIKNGGTKSDKIPLQLVFWPTTQTNRFTWNSDNNQLSYLQLGEINLNDGELPSYKFSELRHYASGSLAEYTDTLTLSKFGWDSIPSMGMAIALKFSGEATIDFDPIAFSITNSGNIATERGGSQNTYIDPLGNIDNVYANNKYNKILSLSQGGLKLSASDIDTKTSSSAGDFILSMDGRTLSFTAHPDFARGPRIVFGGDGNDDGITMSSYGNIDGMTGSWAWKVRDAADHLRLQLPLAENKTGNDGAWMRFRDFTMDIEGAENKLKFTWWSNSGFYGGARVPCLATENVFTGQGAEGSGIGFANGQYVYFTRGKWKQVMI